MRRWVILGVAAAVITVLVIFGRAFLWSEGMAKSSTCRSNLKQLTRAMQMYEEGSGALPPSDSWMDAIRPFHKSPGIEECPGPLFSNDQVFRYAFNSLLSGKKSRSISDPAAVPLIYDSSTHARNASDAVASLPNPGRHVGHNNIACADEHVRAVQR